MGVVRRLPLALLMAALAMPAAAADEGLSWAEVREVTLQPSGAPSIWAVAAALGAVLVVSLGLALLRRR